MRTVSTCGAQCAEHNGCLKRQHRIYPGEIYSLTSGRVMRRTTPVLALSTILASILFAAPHHSADAACDRGQSSCNEPTRGIGPLAEAERRPGSEEWRAREHELPLDLWDRVRSLSIPQDKMEELTKQLMDIVHRYSEASGHVHDAEKRIFDADETIDRAKGDRIRGEGEKRAAEEERGRQFARFIWVLEDALHDFRPPPPPRPEPHWRPHRIFWPHFRAECEFDACAWPNRRR
jgi:hypothetical protein